MTTTTQGITRYDFDAHARGTSTGGIGLDGLAARNAHFAGIQCGSGEAPLTLPTVGRVEKTYGSADAPRTFAYSLCKVEGLSCDVGGLIHLELSGFQTIPEGKYVINTAQGLRPGGIAYLSREVAMALQSDFLAAENDQKGVAELRNEGASFIWRLIEDGLLIKAE